MKSKQALRAQYLAQRSALLPQEVERLSVQLLEQVVHWLAQREELQHFHLFLPIEGQQEVNTLLLKELLEVEGKTLYTSRVRKGELGLDTLKLPRAATLRIDRWGIPVPDKVELVSPESIQVVFVPLLAYDRQGNRLGFGKGYYDVFLGSLSPEVLKVGLSFFDPEEAIPAEAHDVPLDFCVTCSRTWHFSNKKQG
jgi:5-formyltetrahydrofolate cyclo-ligase